LLGRRRVILSKDLTFIQVVSVEIMIIAPFVLFRKKVNIYAYVIISRRTYMKRGRPICFTLLG